MYSRIQELVASLRIGILSGDSQRVKRGEPLSEELTAEVYRLDRNRKIE